METTVEEIMKPRIILLAPIPFCINEVGHIFKMKKNGLNEMYFTILYDDGNNRDIWLEDAEKYPHLFKKLAWHEERQPEDMPEYVKRNYHDSDRVEIRKVLNFRDGVFLTDDDRVAYIEWFEPATFEEYQFQNKK